MITNKLFRAVTSTAGALLAISLAAGFAQAENIDTASTPASAADRLTTTTGSNGMAARPAGDAADFGSVDREASRTWDAATGRQLRAWECNTYHICFWTGTNGTGSRCMWDIADPDWAGGAVVCSWALSRNVASVMNRGTSSDGSTGVAYYTQANYGSRIGCTRNQHGGNLAGTYKLRSHKWISGSCG
jgi:hypothetical protein